MARRAALVGGAVTAAWSLIRPATSPEGQWYAVTAVPVVAVLVYKIAGRVAEEMLR
ncbi:MAG: hypothetical protein IPP98_09775 [Gemmatimonadetes bacterium]|nr:hypothetical protein [Gemmatimonadota bacterium]